MPDSNSIKILSEYFIIEDKRPEREYFIFRCNECKNVYSMSLKNGKIHPGNILSLLNHAMSHLKEESN